MTRRAPVLSLVVGLVACFLTACGGSVDTREIVVTTNILGDVVRNIVGDAGEVRVLMKPNADPHSFGVSAQDAAGMADADLIVYNGLGLEEGVARHVESAAADGVATVAVGEHIDPIEYAAGDSAGAPDPHFWMDPRRMIVAVDVIADAITREVAGIDTGAIEVNASRYRHELDQLDGSMATRFAQIPSGRRNLVTNHHVLGYLAQRYDFNVVGAIVPSGTTLASPSASDLQSLVHAVESTGVPAIFVDSSQPDRLARALAEQARITVRIVGLYTESLSPPGTPGATYLDLMTANAESIVTGLR